MLISPGQLIAGRDAVEVRDTMRRLSNVAYSTNALAHELGISESEAGEHVNALINPELIESVDDPSEYVCLDEEDDRESRPTLWITTIAGNALAKARIGRPIARAKAQELLDGVVARAREMNADPLSLHWITEVVVYGSFVSRDEVLVGDVDIAVQLESRYPRDEYMRRQREMIAVAVPSGRRGSKP